MTRLPALLPLVLMVACGTPQGQCIGRETRDLRILDRLIAETQDNLDRGYALQEVTVYRDRWVLCRPRPAPQTDEANHEHARAEMCLDDYPDTEIRPRAINLADEADKLRAMKVKRVALAKAATPAIAQCRALYPE